MREIKFRAWSILNGKMITQKSQGDCFEPNVDTSKFKNQSLSLNGVLNNTDSLISMQYTGLKDKNGVEIYEGDIVSQHTEWNETEYFEGGYSDSNSCETETIGVVKIYPSKGVVITRCKRMDIIACDDKWERAWDCNVRSIRASVIGNIHQNPELLK